MMALLWLISSICQELGDCNTL